MAGRDESLTDVERVRRSIALGESHFREFKSALQGPPGNKQHRSVKEIAVDIAEALVAFANADGGEIIIGVEDDGTVSGIPHGSPELHRISNAWQTHVHPDTPLAPPRVSRVAVDEYVTVSLAVQKSLDTIHLTSDGRCLQRRDLESVPVSSKAIHLERQEVLSRQYDRTFVDGATADDLHADVLENVASEVAPGFSAEKLLQYLGLAEYDSGGVRLRRAALLLMADDVARWHPRSQVRVIKVDGTELRTGREYNVIEDKSITGPVLALLTRAWEELRPHLVQTRLGPEGLFEEQVRYPEDACREALTNALAHRDYSIEGRPVEIYVFDDRLDVISPGRLLSNVSIEELRSGSGAHQSRNTTCTRVLRELGYMREMGEGIRRIFSLMNEYDLVAPRLDSSEDSFTVSLGHGSVFSDEDQRWVQNYERFPLSRAEQKIVLLGRGQAKISVNQIMETLGIVDTEEYRVLIARLLSKGLLDSIKKKGGRTRRKRRDLPRWTVRQPGEAIAVLGELVRLAAESFSGSDAFESKDFAAVRSGLGPESPFHRQRVDNCLRELQLIDSANRPLGSLKQAIDLGSTRTTEEAATATTRAGGKSRGRSVFVFNLPFGIDEDDLKRSIAAIAAVDRITVPRDVTNAARNRGYGFIEMETDRAAVALVEGDNVIVVEGRKLGFEWRRPTRGR